MLFCMVIDVLFLSTSLSVLQLLGSPRWYSPMPMWSENRLTKQDLFWGNFHLLVALEFVQQKNNQKRCRRRWKIPWNGRAEQVFHWPHCLQCQQLYRGAQRKFMFDEVGFDTHKTGVIKLPILGGFKQFKCMVTLMHVPYDSALFGLVI